MLCRHHKHPEEEEEEECAVVMKKLIHKHTWMHIRCLNCIQWVIWLPPGWCWEEGCRHLWSGVHPNKSNKMLQTALQSHHFPLACYSSVSNLLLTWISLYSFRNILSLPQILKLFTYCFYFWSQCSTIQTISFFKSL